MPARMPQSAPISVEPDMKAPPNPQAAPTIIIPSMPRLSTPARSTTSSPDDASKSGVEAVITVRIKLTENIRLKISMRASTMGMYRFAHGSQQTDAIDNQRIAGQHVEQQDALEHLGEVERDFHRDLRLFAADESQRQKQPGDQDAHRIESSEEGNDDSGEAIARRDVGLQMSHRAGHFDDTGEPGQRPGNRERE